MRKALVAALLSFGLSLHAATVPRPSPELTIVEPSGKTSLLSSYKGKVVLLACVYTTCPHCQALSQTVLSKLQTELGPRGFQAIDVAFNDEVSTPDGAANAKVAATFKSQFQLNYPVGFSNRDTIMKYLGLSIMDRLWVVPQVVIIDRTGTIRRQSDPKGSNELQQKETLMPILDGLLKEGATPGKNTTKKTPAKPADKKST